MSSDCSPVVCADCGRPESVDPPPAIAGRNESRGLWFWLSGWCEVVSRKKRSALLRELGEVAYRKRLDKEHPYITALSFNPRRAADPSASTRVFLRTTRPGGGLPQGPHGDHIGKNGSRCRIQAENAKIRGRVFNVFISCLTEERYSCAEVDPAVFAWMEQRLTPAPGGSRGAR